MPKISSPTTATQESKDKKVDQEAKMLSEIAQLNALSIRGAKFRALIDDNNVDLGIQFYCHSDYQNS